MKLVIGSRGQLASCLNSICEARNMIFAGHSVCDINDKSNLETFIKQQPRITHIINCAAYTKVDAAEDDSEKCYQVNVVGIKNLCEIAAAQDIPIIHISTDYVFDGKKNTPYMVDDQTNPTSVYGQTKLEGEQVFFKSDAKGVIIRTSWLYSEYSQNFVKTMINLGRTKQNINVVYDQIGTPTYALDLARSIWQILPQIKNHKEILHFSNEGVASWYDFAYKIFDYLDIKCEISPVTSDMFKTAAVRPYYSVLDKSKIKNMFDIKIRNWNQALEECLEKIIKKEKNA